ncbi:hypothetical protein PseudUWO311_03935 [Pseudanabaena sp. UWO311]|uniref:hypothetical protein n=1 Tax=Pseudanabaena sp. UWO311 TaxID=2487337 RepID=UPI00115739FC|nr:hypothetical protein [Pseudanabaena sp. UWO311]TYQ28650.1 hypothetical protein PseudUWO311_03935 [Pseudanabaena sp. UWO311]
MAQFYNQHQSNRFSEQVTDITAGSIEKAQHHIYNFFLEIIKRYDSEVILNQFEKLFIKYEEIDNISAYYALGEIIFHNKEGEFKYTLLRCCYILNNNWAINGNISACQKLVDLFLADSIGIPTRIYKLKKLRQWLQSFAQSDEYSTLRSLSGRPGVRKIYHNWSERFSSYLLISEYADSRKPLEQRQYAENLSRKIKKQFKFDLAMYTARLDSKSGANPQRQNPTNLGDGVLLLIKRVLNKQGNDNYRKAARSLYEHSQNITFVEFKSRLLAYLGISQDDLEISEVFRLTVVQKLKHFQEHRDNELMTLSLLLVTCNRVLQYLLLSERRQPSEFLQLSLEYDNFLNPIILLLKIVLIQPHIRFYLEGYIAELIKFYSVYEETECQAFINFLDVLNVTLAIFDEDTDYSLVKMKNIENDLTDINLDNYRVFSQLKRIVDRGKKPVDQDNITETLNF